MRTRSRLSRIALGALLFASLAAAAPVVRRCPLRIQDLDARELAACSAMPSAGICAVAVDRDPLPSAPCAEMESCPLRSSGADDAGCGAAGACDASARDAAACAAAPAPGAPKPAKPGAVCIDEPGMAAASRIDLHSPLPPLALAAILVSIDVPSVARPVPPAADARPPTPPPLAGLTIRGPPALLV